MKKSKYPNVTESLYKSIKSAPNEYREVLSYSLLKYIFDGENNEVPAEALETYQKLQKKIDLAWRSKKIGALGGYTRHKIGVNPNGIPSQIDGSRVAETPVNTEKLETSPARALLDTNINTNINTNILTPPGTSKKEKSIKVINSEFIPPTLEEVVKFFTDNGYKASAGNLCYNYYVDGDWTDSQGRPVTRWKRKVRFNWFKPEYLEAKGSVYTRTQYRPA